MPGWVEVCLVISNLAFAGLYLWGKRSKSTDAVVAATQPPTVSLPAEKSDFSIQMETRMKACELQVTQVHETLRHKLQELAGRKGRKTRDADEPVETPEPVSHADRLAAVRLRGAGVG